MQQTDKLDHSILAHLDSNCRQSNAQIARKVSASREVVAYRIKKLEENGIIEKYIASINPHRLGLQLFRIYVQLENNPEQRQDFVDDMLNSKQIYWMGEFDGAWDYIFVVIAKDQTEFYDWKNELFNKYASLIIKRDTGVVVDVQQYTKKFLHCEPKSVTWGGPITNVLIDDLDKKVLEVLANNARIPAVALSQQVNSNVDTVLRRIKRLEKEQVILQYRIAVDYSKLGLEFYKALITLRGLSQKDHAKLSTYFLNNKQCLYYIRMITSWDIEPEFVVKNYNEFNALIRKFREEFADIVRSVETTIINREWWLPKVLF